MKEAENAIYKQDFESERNDRQRIHEEYEELKTKTEEARQQHKADKDAMGQLAEEKQNCEEEIQVLTAQVNAYSREVDKQKGLLTQSQEKHKTEVSELNKKLANEILSKQQLASVQARLRQQLDVASADKEKAIYSQQQLRQELDNVSADKEELLRAYHEEQTAVTRLEDQIEKLKKANKVLMDKINAYKLGATSATDTPRLSPNSPRRHHRNNAPPTNKPSISVHHNDDSNYQILAHGGGARDEYVMNPEETYHHSNRLYSDDVANVQPLMTAEDM
uniref:Uncharacterized protein n=1 Tax=Amphimedon queenslandica TaxID=400682 RepID=A0A1X7SHF9_AMPQE